MTSAQTRALSRARSAEHELAGSHSGNLGRHRVVIASEAARLGRARFAVLEDAGFELVERYDLIQSKDEDTLAIALKNVWGVVAGGQRFSRRVLESAPSLKIIARTGVGYDGIDVAAATERKITVFITPGRNAESVADHTLALILTGLRQILPLDARVRSGHWRDGGQIVADLHHATVGLVGLGQVGKAVARRLRGFQCRIIGYEPKPDLEFCAEMGLELRSFPELFSQLDVLSVHVPLTAETRHMIGRNELAQLSPRALVVNTSRGGTVDEAALVALLQGGKLAGAAIDVFEHEPLPAGHPLTRLPNTILTPHFAAYSESAVFGMADAVVEGLVRYADGHLPDGALNLGTVSSVARQADPEADPDE